MIILQIVAILQLILLGFHFGRRKGQMWCLSLLVIIVFDGCIIESIHVIIRTFIVKICMHVCNTYH